MPPKPPSPAPTNEPDETRDYLPGQEPLDEILEDTLDEPVQPELPGVQPSQPQPTSQESVEERLSKALSTIDTLTSEVRSLREAPPYRQASETPGAQPEFETILGVPVPKDRSRRHVRLSQNDLLAMKWNEDPTVALETLGNVLVNYILGAVPEIIQQHVTSREQTQNQRTTRRKTYDTMFPDLVEFRDLGEVVERQLRNEGYDNRYTGEEYLKQVGTAVRRRLAGMRGQTLEQYEEELKTRQPGLSQGPVSREAPRTLSPTPGVRTARRVVGDAQQREMQDLL